MPLCLGSLPWVTGQAGLLHWAWKKEWAGSAPSLFSQLDQGPPIRASTPTRRHRTGGVLQTGGVWEKP